MTHLLTVTAEEWADDERRAEIRAEAERLVLSTGEHVEVYTADYMVTVIGENLTGYVDDDWDDDEPDTVPMFGTDTHDLS